MITNYALWYIEQVDGIEALTRDEIMDNLNALYGVPVPTFDVSTDDLREELRFQIDRDWQLDEPLMNEILYWRYKNADIEVNEDAEYSVEYKLYGDEVKCKNVYQPNGNNWFGDDWRMCHIQRESHGRYFVTYRRYPLIDAARIEAQ